MVKAIKSNLRLCHLADVHLGYRRFNRLTKFGFNQREADVNQAFREAVDRILKLAPGLVVVAGDLFHTVRPSNAILTFAFKEIRRLSRGISGPVIIVAGNHESPRRVDSGSPLRILAELERVYVVDSKVEQLSFSELDLSVTCVPHAALASGQELRLRADDRYSHNILVVHGQVCGSILTDFGGAEIDLDRANVHEWDYIALGHVHVHKDIGLNAAYPGAIEHTASNIWSHLDVKLGFLEVVLGSGKRHFHGLTSPRGLVWLEPIDASSLDSGALLELVRRRINDVVGGISDKIVRLQINSVARETFREINHRELRRLKAPALNFTLEMVPPKIEEALKPKKASSSFGGKDRLIAELVEFTQASQPDAGVDLVELLHGYVTKVEALDEAR